LAQKNRRGTRTALELGRPDDYDEPSRAQTQSALLAVYLYGRARINNWGSCSRSNSNSLTPDRKGLAQFWHSSNTVKREEQGPVVSDRGFARRGSGAPPSWRFAASGPWEQVQAASEVGSQGASKEKKTMPTKRSTKTIATPMTGAEAVALNNRLEVIPVNPILLLDCSRAGSNRLATLHQGARGSISFCFQSLGGTALSAFTLLCPENMERKRVGDCLNKLIF